MTRTSAPSGVPTASPMTEPVPTPAPEAPGPRLRLADTASRRSLLDGGWWPRSTDPVAELPALVLAIDELRGPVTHLVLGAAGWSDRPRRLRVGERTLRVGYFTNQPASLLTAFCANDDRIDLLVVPPETERGTADAATALAATADNRTHAPDILAAVGPATGPGPGAGPVVPAGREPVS